MARNTSSVTLVGGLDIGNGYVKGMIENRDTKAIDTIDIPSGVSLMLEENKLPIDDADALGVVSGDGDYAIFNQLDASISSPLVRRDHRRLFGKRGLSAPGEFEQFDVMSHLSKAEQELSKILVLGLFAAKAAKDVVIANNGVVPNEPINATIVAVLALPITEFADHRLSYAKAFTQNQHSVTIRLFETPIVVNLRFAGIDVMPEGASAQFAITNKGEPLAAAMLADVRRHTSGYEEITPADVVAATNTVGVDIGEGTVNFPIYTDMRFNRDSSTSLDKGYGSALTQALQDMKNASDPSGLKSRKQLADFLQKKPSNLKRKPYDRVKRYVDRQAEFFCEEVTREFGRVMSAGGVGAMTEAVFVYGGGAGAVKGILYPMLVAKAKEINGDDAPVVLYLDPQYSRNLNREGLFIAANKLAPTFLKNVK